MSGKEGDSCLFVLDGNSDCGCVEMIYGHGYFEELEPEFVGQAIDALEFTRSSRSSSLVVCELLPRDGDHEEEGCILKENCAEGSILKENCAEEDGDDSLLLLLEKNEKFERLKSMISKSSDEELDEGDVLYNAILKIKELQSHISHIFDELIHSELPLTRLEKNLRL